MSEVQENSFCANHAKNEGNICRNKNDIKSVSENLHDCIDRVDQRMLAMDHAETISHGNIFDNIRAVDKSNISIKIFGIVVGTFTVMLIAILGYQTSLIKGASEVHAVAMEKSTASFTKDVDKMVVQMDGIDDNIHEMKIDINSVQKDLANLNFNFIEYKQRNDKEHGTFQKIITPNAWRNEHDTD